jgi:hypothetical protein
MRFIPSLLLSLCCLAVALQGNAVDIPVKPAKASHEYRAAEQAVPNDALNDHYHITAARNTVINNAFSKEYPSNCNGNTDKSTIAYILNDSFQNLRLVLSGDHAKAFRNKLIFPQHYYW